MLRSPWTVEFGEVTDSISNSRSLLEPILEENSSEEEECYDIWSQYDTVWSSESDTGSVIRVNLNQEADCSSEREFACPPKRRKHEFDINSDVILQDLTLIRKSKYDPMPIKLDSNTDIFGKRYDLRMNRNEDFLQYNELYSDSDSLSFASLSRSSSLVQFESLEKQLLSDTNSFGSSPSIYSQVSLDITTNEQQQQQQIKQNIDNKKNFNYFNNEENNKQTLNNMKLNYINGFHNNSITSSTSPSSSYSSIIINNTNKDNNLDNNLDGDDSLIQNEINLKNSIQKNKNSIENLSEDSGYCENFSNFLRTKSKSIPCIKKSDSNNLKYNLENDNDSNNSDLYDNFTIINSKSMENITNKFNYQYKVNINEDDDIDIDDDHNGDDDADETIQINRNLYLDKKIKTLSTNNNKEKNATKFNLKENTKNSNEILKETNFYDSINKKCNSLPRRSSPLLHKKIGLIFNSSYPDNLNQISNNLAELFISNNKVKNTNNRANKSLNNVKDFSVVSSVPENLNIICNQDINNTIEYNNKSDYNSKEYEIYSNVKKEDIHNKSSDLDDSLFDRNTFLSVTSYNSFNFESGCSYKPSLTMSYANLTLLNDDEDDDSKNINFENKFLYNDNINKESIISDFSTNFDRELSILNDQDLNYDPCRRFVEKEKAKKYKPEPPVRKIFPKTFNKGNSTPPFIYTSTSSESLNNNNMKDIRRTFDQDPTNLITNYTASLEKCNFDIDTPIRVDSLEYLKKPKSNSFDNSFISSTPNLNLFISENCDERKIEQKFKSMRQITENNNNPIRKTRSAFSQSNHNNKSTTNSKNNLYKGVSFCPIVSEIVWTKTITDKYFQSSDESFPSNSKDEDDDDENDEYTENDYKYENINEEDDFTYFNPPTTKMFTITTNNLSNSTPIISEHSTTFNPMNNTFKTQNNNNNNNNNNKSNITTFKETPLLVNTINNKNTEFSKNVNSLTKSNTTNSSVNDHGNSYDRDLIVNTNTYKNSLNECNEKENKMNIIMDRTIQTNTVTTPTQNNLNKVNLSKENFSCSMSMKSVESKPLITTLNNNIHKNNNNSQVKMNSNNKSNTMDSTPNRIVDGKKSKSGNSFLSRLTSFRFSLNKSKKNNKKDIINTNNMLNDNNENNKNSVQMNRSNELEKNNTEVQLLNKNSVSNNSEVHVNKNYISEVQINTLNNNNNNINSVIDNEVNKTNFIYIPLKDPNTACSSFDELDLQNINKELSVQSKPIILPRQNQPNKSINMINNNQLVSKPPLPKAPPRIVSVATKQKRINQNNQGGINKFLLYEKLNSTYNNDNHEICDKNLNTTSPHNKIGLIETNLDTDETFVSGKTRSLMELIPNQYINPIQRYSNNNTINYKMNESIMKPKRPHKSMEFLLDKENQKDFLAPENELQKSHDTNNLSEHQLRIQTSLQRLNVPDWFKEYNASQQKEGGYTGNFYRKRNSDSGKWTGLYSKTTSLSSLGSHRSDKSPLLLSPSAHSHHGQTGFSRWSTSHLNSNQTSPSISTRSSFVRGNLNASNISGNSYTPGNTTNIRSSFRQPYLGWRSQEKLANPRTPHERLASSILSKQPSPNSQKPAPETEEIQSSIKEVTSAIVHYVNDQNSRTSARSRSASPNTRKCWLESSFVGNRPLESPQTPTIEKSIHDSTGGNTYNGGGKWTII